MNNNTRNVANKHMAMAMAISDILGDVAEVVTSTVPEVCVLCSWLAVCVVTKS
jgi:hypothetical protein